VNGDFVKVNWCPRKLSLMFAGNLLMLHSNRIKSFVSYNVFWCPRHLRHLAYMHSKFTSEMGTVDRTDAPQLPFGSQQLNGKLSANLRVVGVSAVSMM
jgi:hypothetical protein